MKTVNMNYAVMVVALLAFGPCGAGAAPFKPTDISGSVLWLDAADAGTLTTNSGGYVSQWSDKSAGGAGTMTKADTEQPLSGAVTLNGLNVLQFSGTDYMAGGAVLTGNDDDYTYIAVWRSHRTSGGQAVFEQGSGGNQRASMLLVNGRYGFNGEANDRHDLAPFSVNEWRMAYMEVENSWYNNIRLYDNDTYYFGRTGNPSTLSIGTQGSRVGAKVLNNSEIFDGEIAEIIVYDRVLTDTERAAVHYYLNSKWALDLHYEECDAVVDFEYGIMPEGWTATGIFTNQPGNNARVFFNKHGEFLIDTFYGLTNGVNFQVGDEATGELTGDAFVLESNTVRARLGGGNIGAGIQFQLQRQKEDASWEVVRRSTGRNYNLMRELIWNTENLVGDTVRFKALDNHTGGWGILVLDYIRLLNYPVERSILTDFTGSELPAGLHAQCQKYGGDIGVTGSGAAYMEFTSLNDKYDSWSTVDNAARIVVNTVDDEQFVMQTHITSRSLTNSDSHTGLVLDFEAPTALNGYSYNMAMFGPYGNTLVKLEGPVIGQSIPAVNLGYTITNIHLRVEGRNDTFTFKYSEDGINWSTLGTHTWPDLLLMQAGMFSKRWGTGTTTTQRVEFDSFSYQSIKKIAGTVILVN